MRLLLRLLAPDSELPSPWLLQRVLLLLLPHLLGQERELPKPFATAESAVAVVEVALAGAGQSAAQAPDRSAVQYTADVCLIGMNVIAGSRQ